MTATKYLAYVGDGADPGEARQLHLVRADAEVALCGMLRSDMSSHGQIDDLTVCRQCVDWVPKRWTGNMPKVKAG